MNRLRPLLFCILILCNGCAILSKSHYVTVDEDFAKKSHDSCGYSSPFYDELLRLGSGNKSIIEESGFIIEICSKPHRSTDLALGFLLPILPFGGSGISNHGEGKWIRIKNKSKIQVFSIDESLLSINGKQLESYVCDEEYPSSSNSYSLNWRDGEKKDIIPDQFVWLSLSEGDAYLLRIRLDENLILSIKLKNTSRIVWWYLNSV